MDADRALSTYLIAPDDLPDFYTGTDPRELSAGGFLSGARYIILNRDPLYTAAFRRMLKDSGVNVLRLPARSPDLNGYAERFVLSIKSECLNRVIPLNENHLRSTINEFVRHYHDERLSPHQGFDN